jgi:hypothetical protein
MLISAAALCLTAASTAIAAPFNVLWWDSTQSYGAQNDPSLRQSMSDFLTNHNGGANFSSTYVRSRTPGALAAQLSSNSYDVVVFDSTSQSSPFDNTDLAAVQAFYADGNRNLLLDGSLYIRSIQFNADTVFPGPGGGMGALTLNSVYELGQRGGGVMIGTDHNCCQVDANAVLQALVPGAGFFGVEGPSTDGVFYGAQLLNNLVATAPINVLTHWSTEGTQGIPPVGAFTDFQGDAITLYSQVDVAPFVGGTRTPRISTSWQPGTGSTGVGEEEPPPPGGGGGGGVVTVPEPTSLAILGLAVFGLAAARRSRPC